MSSDKERKFILWLVTGVVIYALAVFLFAALMDGDSMRLFAATGDLFIAAGGGLSSLGKFALYAAGGLVAVVAVVIGVGCIGASYSRSMPEPIDHHQMIARQLSEARRSGDRERLSSLLDAVSPNYALKVAAEHGEHDIVKQLIARGASPNGYPEEAWRDESALSAAVGSHSVETVKTLIAAGADVHRETGFASTTPLQETSLRDDWEIIKCLLDHGADRQQFIEMIEAADRIYADKYIEMLLEIGEVVRALEVARATTGVELPVPDATLLTRAHDLRSAFIAYAERFKDQGNFGGARRLCEWKIEAWKGVLYPSAEITADMPVCLRILAEINEAEGNLQEALRLCLHALGKWKCRSTPGTYTAMQDDEDTALGLLTDAVLQGIVSHTDAGREDSAALLRGCERILGRLGMTEELGRVAAALRKVEEV